MNQKLETFWISILFLTLLSKVGLGAQNFVSNTPRLADSAEQIKIDLSQQILGYQIPDFIKPCDITYRNDRGTGGATSYIPGMTDFSITVQGDLNDALPHEITHTILATHLAPLLSPTVKIPRWLDEGLASLAESKKTKEGFLKDARQCLQERRCFQLNHLLIMDEYPRDVFAFYSQSHSLVTFLVQKFGTQKVILYTETILSKGYGEGLKVFGYSSYQEMQDEWVTWVSGTTVNCCGDGYGPFSGPPIRRHFIPGPTPGRNPGLPVRSYPVPVPTQKEFLGNPEPKPGPNPGPINSNPGPINSNPGPINSNPGPINSNPGPGSIDPTRSPEPGPAPKWGPASPKEPELDYKLPGPDPDYKAPVPDDTGSLVPVPEKAPIPIDTGPLVPVPEKAPIPDVESGPKEPVPVPVVKEPIPAVKVPVKEPIDKVPVKEPISDARYKIRPITIIFSPTINITKTNTHQNPPQKEEKSECDPESRDLAHQIRLLERKLK